MFFIDWVTVVVDIPHYSSDGLGYGGDRFIKFSPKTGQIKYEGRSPEPLKGSFDNSIIIKSQGETYESSGSYDQLYIHGNLGKWLNGHNLWGCSDLDKLILETLLSLPHISDITYQTNPHFVINSGSYRISRIDLTCHFECGDDEKSVERWLISAANNADAKYRGRGVFSNQTLRFGSSRRCSYKFYGKFKEVIANKDYQFILDPSLIELVRNHLRFELTCRSTQLSTLNIHTGKTFNIDILKDYAMTKLNELSLPSKINLSTQDIDDLTPTAKLAYHNWLSGTPLSSQFTKRSGTYYRVKKQLSDIGINLECPPPADQQSRIVSLASIITARPAIIPDQLIKSLKVA